MPLKMRSYGPPVDPDTKPRPMVVGLLAALVLLSMGLLPVATADALDPTATVTTSDNTPERLQSDLKLGRQDFASR